MNQTLQSSRFGTLVVPRTSLIEFPSGLIGLPGTRYALLEHGETAFTWLHSADYPEVAMPVVDPISCFGNFKIALSGADIARIGVGDVRDTRLYVTVRLDPVLHAFTANLRAPLVLAGGRGHQVINHAREASLRAPIPGRPNAAQRQSHGVPSASNAFQGGNPCSSSPGVLARRSCSATTSSSR